MPDHSTDPVARAARWLADQPEPPRPIIPALRARFGLSAPQAIQAIRLATKMPRAA
jgi:hypothetical protein